MCHLSYEAVEEEDKNNIVLYCLPSNTTHKLQPLDKSVNRSFEHHWYKEVLNYLSNSLERTLNKVAFNNIFSRTWPKSITQTNITNGFKATGLYPIDPDVIPQDAYAPSIITERPLPETQDQIDQPLISVQVSAPVTEFNKVSELLSPSLIDESRSTHASHVSSIVPSTSKETTVSTSSKFSDVTKNRKPVLVCYSSLTDASDMELDNTVSDPLPSLYNNPVQSMSGLQENIVYSSSESDLDLNLSESFAKNNYMSKLQVSDLYSSYSSFGEDPDQREKITPKKQSGLKKKLTR